MTTTKNNHLTLIEKVGGIEKAKGIVEAVRIVLERGNNA